MLQRFEDLPLQENMRGLTKKQVFTSIVDELYNVVESKQSVTEVGIIDVEDISGLRVSLPEENTGELKHARTLIPET